eukprot:GFYU01061734.1.p1 GENE.GFYU01061734.1~~GFYU01061734.1.p1  ORF type:complete len:168 (-),score=21.89 GFYU01061734.1:37-540(-)
MHTSVQSRAQTRPIMHMCTQMSATSVSRFISVHGTSTMLMTYSIESRHHLQRFLLPAPILQHLGWRLHEVTFHVSATESTVLCTAEQSVHHVTKLVKVRLHFVMHQQRWLLCESTAHHNRNKRREMMSTSIPPHPYSTNPDTSIQIQTYAHTHPNTQSCVHSHTNTN